MYICFRFLFVSYLRLKIQFSWFYNSNWILLCFYKSYLVPILIPPLFLNALTNPICSCFNSSLFMYAFTDPILLFMISILFFFLFSLFSLASELGCHQNRNSSRSLKAQIPCQGGSVALPFKFLEVDAMYSHILAIMPSVWLSDKLQKSQLGENRIHLKAKKS